MHVKLHQSHAGMISCTLQNSQWHHRTQSDSRLGTVWFLLTHRLQTRWRAGCRHTTFVWVWHKEPQWCTSGWGWDCMYFISVVCSIEQRISLSLTGSEELGHISKDSFCMSCSLVEKRGAYSCLQLLQHKMLPTGSGTKQAQSLHTKTLTHIHAHNTMTVRTGEDRDKILLVSWYLCSRRSRVKAQDNLPSTVASVSLSWS